MQPTDNPALALLYIAKRLEYEVDEESFLRAAEELQKQIRNCPNNPAGGFHEYEAFTLKCIFCGRIASPYHPSRALVKSQR